MADATGRRQTFLVLHLALVAGLFAGFLAFGARF